MSYKIIVIKRQLDPIESLWSVSNESVYKVCVGFSYNNSIPIIQFSIVCLTIFIVICIDISY